MENSFQLHFSTNFSVLFRLNDYFLQIIGLVGSSLWTPFITCKWISYAKMSLKNPTQLCRNFFVDFSRAEFSCLEFSGNPKYLESVSC